MVNRPLDPKQFAGLAVLLAIQDLAASAGRPGKRRAARTAGEPNHPPVPLAMTDQAARRRAGRLARRQRNAAAAAEA